MNETGDARDAVDLGLRGVVNFRDFGGHAVADGRVRTGRVFRSDSLAYVEPDDLEALVTRLGIRSVLDLRSDMERATAPLAALEGAGVRLVSIPLVDPTRPASIPLDIATVTLIGLYEFILETSGDRFNVQLMNRARRSEKSHCDCSPRRSCISVNFTPAAVM